MLQSVFNLVDDPWIPVYDFEGVGMEVSLKELFTNAHTYKDFNTPGVEKGIFVRLAVAITLRVRQWEESWETGAFTNAHTQYLETHREKFDLANFLQIHNISDYATKKISIVPVSNLFKINPHVNAEIETTLTLTEAEAARALLFHNVLAVGGVQPGVGQSMKANQALGDTGFFAQGDSLFSTIAMNTPEQSEEEYNQDTTFWETPVSISKLGQPHTPAGIADYLMYPARMVELFQEDDKGISGVKIWVGYKHEMASQEELLPISPFSIFVQREGEWKRENFFRKTHTRPLDGKKTRRMSWQPSILTGMFALYSPELDSRSLVINRVNSLPSHWERFLGFTLGGTLVNDKKSVIEGTLDEAITFPSSLLVGEHVEEFMSFLALNLETHNRLLVALKTLDPSLSDSPEVISFARHINITGKQLFQGRASSEELQRWEQECRLIAQRLFERNLSSIPVERIASYQPTIRGFLSFCRKGAD